MNSVYTIVSKTNGIFQGVFTASSEEAALEMLRADIGGDWDNKDGELIVSKSVVEIEGRPGHAALPEWMKVEDIDAVLAAHGLARHGYPENVEGEVIYQVTAS